MAAPKKSTPKSRALSRSASRAAGASRAAARKTSAKQERAAVSRSIAKPGKVSESGVGWGNVARAAASVFGRAAKKPQKTQVTASQRKRAADWGITDSKQVAAFAKNPGYGSRQQAAQYRKNAAAKKAAEQKAAAKKELSTNMTKHLTSRKPKPKAQSYHTPRTTKSQRMPDPRRGYGEGGWR